MTKATIPRTRRRWGRICWLALVGFTSTCFLPNSVWSQTASKVVSPLPQNPPNAPAEAQFQKGVTLAQERRFEDAVNAFAESFDLGANRAALFAWAQSQRLAGNCQAAVPLYQQFVTVSEAPEETQAAEIGLRRCQEALLRRQDKVQTPSLKQAPSPPATNGWAVAVASSGVALITTSVVLALVSETERRAADRASTYEDHRVARERSETQRWVAVATGGVGLATLALGLWLYKRPSESPAAKVSLSPLPHAAGLIMAWRGSF